MIQRFSVIVTACVRSSALSLSKDSRLQKASLSHLPSNL